MMHIARLRWNFSGNSQGLNKLTDSSISDRVPEWKQHFEELYRE
jgi:hypothetical protein